MNEDEEKKYIEELTRWKDENIPKSIAKKSPFVHPSSGKKKTQKPPEYTYPKYYYSMSKLLELEKNAQRLEFNHYKNNNLRELSERDLAFIDIYEFFGPQEYFGDIFEDTERISYSIKFVLKPIHKKTFESGNFKDGSTVYIFVDEPGVEYSNKHFSEESVVKASVDYIDERGIVLILSDKERRAFLSQRPKAKKFAILKGIDETTIKIQKEALELFSKGQVKNQLLCEIIANNIQPSYNASKKVDAFFLELNEYQQDCVSRSFENNDIFLIHGPPGTGKTRVCSEIIAQNLLRNPDSRILVTADSNQAVDNILDHVAKVLPPQLYVKLLRVGIPRKIRGNNKIFMLLEQMKRHPLNVFIDQIRSEKKGLFLEKKGIIGKIDSELIDNEIKGLSEQSITQFMTYVMGECNRIKYGLVYPESLYRLKKVIKLRLEKAHAIENYAEKKALRLQLNGLLTLIKNTLKEYDSKNIDNYDLIDNIDSKIKTNNKVIKELRRQIYFEILMNANVIFCTNTTSGKPLITKTFHDRGFDILIIDESTQSTELSAIIPITISRKVIMAGDHRQLPPTISLRTTQDEEDEDAQKIRIDAASKLEKTLFERLIERFDAVPDSKSAYHLRIQYRMKESIVPFINEHFYDNRLESDSFIKEKSKDVNEKSLVFIDCYAKESVRSHAKSHSNLGECNVVAHLIDLLLKNASVRPSDIGIITPYSAQVSLLRRAINNPDIKISTVDGFQGQERNIIILSTVRSSVNKGFFSWKSDIGFLAEMRRLNVMITRFREKLFIVGNQETLSAHKIQQLHDGTRKPILYYALIEYISKHQGGLIINENMLSSTLPHISINYQTYPDQMGKFSGSYENLCDILHKKLKNRFSFNFLIKKDQIKNNVYLRKYTAIDRLYGDSVLVDVRQSIDDNLEAVESIGSEDEPDYQTISWKYFDPPETRRKVIDYSVAENGKNLVTGLFQFMYFLTPLNIEIKTKINEDLAYLNNPIDINYVSQLPELDKFDKIKTEENIDIVKTKLEVLLLNPEDPSSNFLKIQNAIFEHLQGNVFILDYCVRRDGLKKIYAHLKTSPKLETLKILTGPECTINWGENITIEYVQLIRGYAQDLGYEILVRIKDGLTLPPFSLHDRYIINEKKGGWAVPPFNKLETLDAIITPFDDGILSEKFSKFMGVFVSDSLDILSQTDDVFSLTEKKLTKKI